MDPPIGISAGDHKVDEWCNKWPLKSYLVAGTKVGRLINLGFEFPSPDDKKRYQLMSSVVLLVHRFNLFGQVKPQRFLCISLIDLRISYRFVTTSVDLFLELRVNNDDDDVLRRPTTFACCCQFVRIL